MHTAPYFTALGLIAVINAVRVIRLRIRHNVSLGDGGIPDLNQAVRAFGNFSEYAPLGLVLLFALEYVQAPVWYLHLCGTTLLVGRMLHAFAFSKLGVPAPPRVAGMMLTFFSITVSAIGVTVFSMMELRA